MGADDWDGRERRRERDDHDLLIETAAKLNTMKEALDALDDNFVYKSDFIPVRNIVYGFTGLILSAVLVALLAQVIVQK